MGAEIANLHKMLYTAEYGVDDAHIRCKRELKYGCQRTNKRYPKSLHGSRVRSDLILGNLRFCGYRIREKWRRNPWRKGSRGRITAQQGSSQAFAIDTGVVGEREVTRLTAFVNNRGRQRKELGGQSAETPSLMYVAPCLCTHVT